MIDSSRLLIYGQVGVWVGNRYRGSAAWLLLRRLWLCDQCKMAGFTFVHWEEVGTCRPSLIQSGRIKESTALRTDGNAVLLKFLVVT